MIQAAAKQGWIDHRAVTLEMLIAMHRAGANLIVTYAVLCEPAPHDRSCRHGLTVKLKERPAGEQNDVELTRLPHLERSLAAMQCIGRELVERIDEFSGDE